jgi:hypothetical protein
MERGQGGPEAGDLAERERQPGGLAGRTGDGPLHPEGGAGVISRTADKMVYTEPYLPGSSGFPVELGYLTTEELDFEIGYDGQSVMTDDFIITGSAETPLKRFSIVYLERVEDDKEIKSVFGGIIVGREVDTASGEVKFRGIAFENLLGHAVMTTAYTDDDFYPPFKKGDSLKGDVEKLLYDAHPFDNWKFMRTTVDDQTADKQGDKVKVAKDLSYNYGDNLQEAIYRLCDEAACTTYYRWYDDGKIGMVIRNKTDYEENEIFSRQIDFNESQDFYKYNSLHYFGKGEGKYKTRVEFYLDYNADGTPIIENNKQVTLTADDNEPGAYADWYEVPYFWEEELDSSRARLKNKPDSEDDTAVIKGALLDKNIKKTIDKVKKKTVLWRDADDSSGVATQADIVSRIPGWLSDINKYCNYVADYTDKYCASDLFKVESMAELKKSIDPCTKKAFKLLSKRRRDRFSSDDFSSGVLRLGHYDIQNNGKSMPVFKLKTDRLYFSSAGLVATDSKGNKYVSDDNLRRYGMNFLITINQAVSGTTSLSQLLNDGTHAACLDTRANDAKGHTVALADKEKQEDTEYRSTFPYVSKKDGYIGLDPSWQPVFDFNDSPNVGWKIASNYNGDDGKGMMVRIYAFGHTSKSDGITIYSPKLVTKFNAGALLEYRQAMYNPRIMVDGVYPDDEDDEKTTADDTFEKVVGYFTDAERLSQMHQAARRKLIEVRSTDTVDLDISKVINMGDYKDMWRGDIFRFEDRERGRKIMQSVFVSGVVVKSGNGSSTFEWKFTNIQDPFELS